MYLDGPGGSQVPERVIEAMAACLHETNANLGGAFASSRRATELVEQGRVAAAQLTGSQPEEIAFGASMTTLNFQLAHAVARTLEPGDEIVVTDLDHDANVSPWLLVAADHGLVVSARAAARRGRHARPRRARGAGRRAHARGGVHARLERGRLDHRRRAHRRRGARGRSARLGGRGAPRAAPTARSRRARAGRAAVLALQVLRPPSRDRGDQAGAG